MSGFTAFAAIVAITVLFGRRLIRLAAKVPIRGSIPGPPDGRAPRFTLFHGARILLSAESSGGNSMSTRTARDRSRSRIGAFVFVVLAAVMIASPSSDGRAGTSTYSIDLHRIGAGGGSLRNACYRLSGSVGQPAPGYSSGATLSVDAGFWPAVAIDQPDQLFFSGFEGC
ncbi:hypothetical protein [Tahibacter caeni]|uniref:hypothetical protein n=1 Tax=Tahibacter caeni TaxID=1453545 RepID=UPI00214914E7|nr:hypothetical protein [Tahibacter caeni]